MNQILGLKRLSGQAIMIHAVRGLLLEGSVRREGRFAFGCVRLILWTLCVICALALLTIQPSHLEAQASAGITGTVTDTTGSVIPNASVSITNDATGVTQHVVTSGAGTYAVSGLLPGPYRVTVDASGFKRSVKDGVLVEIGTQSTINFTMQAGAATQTVQVIADSIALNTTQPQIGTTIEPELLHSLPNELSGRGREVATFQFLAPGVQGNTFTTEVSGGVWFQEEVVYNGVPMPQAETEGMQTFIDPPWEMVKEFRVQTSTFSAQYGLAQGAVNYQTASGTNQFHGDAFEINRNSSFDSQGFFNSTVPVDHENNYGFTLGGPIIIPKTYNGRNRAFFHFSSEWYRQNATVTGSNDTVPTEQERTGDFTDFVNGQTGQLIPIYDPTTGKQFEYNGVLNVIPPDRISTESKALLQYLPNPDRQGLNIGGLDQNRNYDPYPNPTLNSNWGYTLDYNLTPTQSLHWSQWRDRLTTNQVFVLGPLVAPPNPLNAVAAELQLGSGFILNYTNTITPHLVMTAGAGWLGEINNEIPTTPVNLPVVENGVVMPQISFDGFHAPTQWGTSGSLQDSINRKLGIDLVNNWLWTKGRNTFNIGGEMRRLYQDALQAGDGGGHISFSHDETSTPPMADGNNGPDFANDGSSFASFLLGLPDSANRTFAEALKLRNFDISPYIQDDIKLAPRLTVNLGVRWDIMVPFTENNNRIAFLNPSVTNLHTGTLGTATTLGTCSTCVGWNRASIHWGHVGPRIGFAYMLNSKTVVQSGFSLAFLNGGAYQFGDTLVADNYSGLLAGTYNLGSSGTNVSNYGEWDTNTLPAPPASPISPTSGIASTIYELSQDDGYAPYTEQWNVNIQRELPYDMFLTVAYVGNREIHILSNLNHPNQYPDSVLALGSKLNDSFYTGTAQADGFQVPYANFISDLGPNATVYQALKPFPQYASVMNEFEGSGTVFYNGMQTQLEKRYTNGLAFLSSLTIARTLSNNDGGNGAFAASSMDKYRQSQEWGVASSDQKYNVKLSGTYELPLGRGKRWVNSGSILPRIVGGMQVSAILDYEGGTPYSVTQTGIPAQPNGFNRPNRVSSVHLSTYSYGRVKAHFLNPSTPAPAMFNIAAFSPTGSDYVLGNAQRGYSSLRGNPYRNENLSASKSFTVHDDIRFKLQVDFFNAFNRALLSSSPNTNMNTTAASPNPAFGLVTGGSQTNSNRQGQASLRIEF
jgi:Carboxypeptidase regulatory-like domain